MPSDFVELILFQVFYISIIALIIWKAVGKHSLVPYCIFIGIYIITLIWLVFEYFCMSATGNGGHWFAISMYSIIVPGILTGLSLLWFILNKSIAKMKDEE